MRDFLELPRARSVSDVISRLWNSPTFSTWASFLVQTLNLVLVLPFILTHFSTEEIALWQLFRSVISLQPLIELGFLPTFVRVIAYAVGGADDLEVDPNVSQMNSVMNTSREVQPNWEMVDQIYGTMRVIYRRIASFSFVLVLAIGTWALIRPISMVEDAISSWIAWGILVVVLAISTLGNKYQAYLMGVDEIPLLRRWETVTYLGAIITNMLVLLIGADLLTLVLSSQTWVLLKILINRWLCGQVRDGRFEEFSGSRLHPEVFQSVWPSAWRSSLGQFASYGLTQFSGFIYAQIGSASSIASYLLALRLAQNVKRFSNAPFYSQLPTLARLLSAGKIKQQLKLAQRGMRFTYWTFVAGFVGLGILGPPLLNAIGSNADFADPVLWALMGLGLFAERYGAMHLQLYSTTNHIIWHIANGGAGLIFVLVSLGLFQSIGVYAFPLGNLVGYLGFYAWYCAKHSYETFGISFWPFESRAMLIPLVVLLVYCATSIII